MAAAISRSDCGRCCALLDALGVTDPRRIFGDKHAEILLSKADEVLKSL